MTLPGQDGRIALLVGLSDDRLRRCLGVMVCETEDPVAAVMVDGVKYSLPDLLKERFGERPLAVYVVNSTITKERTDGPA